MAKAFFVESQRNKSRIGSEKIENSKGDCICNPKYCSKESTCFFNKNLNGQNISTFKTYHNVEICPTCRDKPGSVLYVFKGWSYHVKKCKVARGK